MKRLFGFVVALVLGLALSGCANSEAPVGTMENLALEVDSQEISESSTLTAQDLVKVGPSNLVLKACEDFTYKGGEDWLEAYELLISDMCAQEGLESSVIDLRVGKNIVDKPISFYLDPVLFHLSYFNSFSEGGIKTVPLIAVSEFDKEFWNSELESLLDIDFEWYSLSDAGGHCGYRYEAEAYCQNIYIPEETIDGISVLTLFMGEEEVFRNHDTWKRSLAAHAATHAVQYQKKMTHFTQWVIEGQAHLHELAYQQLVSGETVRFSKYLGQPMTRDENRLDPSSEESIRLHIEECQADGHPCLEFSAIAGSIYLEKLILDHGVESYKNFFAKIWAASDAGMSQADMEEYFADQTFQGIYGVSMDEWLDEIGIPYLARVYADAGYSS